MQKVFLTIVIFSIFSVIFCSEAHALILWDWEFINSDLNVKSTDTVIAWARLYNNSTAGEVFGSFRSTDGKPFDAYVVSTSGWLFDEYFEYFGPRYGDFFDQFINMDLKPGESIDFIQETWIPKGIIHPESYSLPPSKKYLADVNLHIQRASDFGDLGTIYRDFKWQVIPEPATMLLFSTGLLGAFFIKHRK